MTAKLDCAARAVPSVPTLVLAEVQTMCWGCADCLDELRSGKARRH